MCEFFFYLSFCGDVFLNFAVYHKFLLMFFFCEFQVEKELTDICQDVLDVIDNHLMGAAVNNKESEVFYYKM